MTDQDPRATARGNAFAATADNPSAVYYNPAGIAQLAGHQVRFGSYAVSYQSSYESPAGGSVESERAFEALPQFYYTFTPERLPVSFGLGVYSPFGLSMEWLESSGFRTLGTEGRVTYVTLSPVVAWQVHRTFAIAAGATVNYSEADLRQGLSPVAGNDEFRFKGDDIAPGFILGARWQPVSNHAFGLVYRSAATLDYHGHTETRSTAPPLALRQPASARFEYPQMVTAGWSWRPAPGWNLEVNVDWMDWQSFDRVDIRQSTPVPPLVLNWRSSWLCAFGVTREFGEGWSASAGYLFSENSTRDSNYNPLVPDTDRHSWSAGLGRRGKRWEWNVAYQFTYGAPNTVRGSAPSLAGQSADGRYSFLSHALTASVGFKF